MDPKYSMSEPELARLREQIRKDEKAVEPRLAFDKEEYASRLSQLYGMMRTAGVDVVLLSSPELQCWLHGYQARWYRTGSTTEWPPCNFTAVKLYDGMIVFDSSDHSDLIHFTSIAIDIRHFDDPKHAGSADASLKGVHRFVVDELKTKGWLSGKCGLERWSPRQNAATTEDLVSRLHDHVKVVDVSVMLRDLQRIKSEAELKVMREASRILDAAYKHLKNHISPDMTEIQVWAMAQEGGETAGLHNTVSRTRNYCHAFSSIRPIGVGPLLVDPCGVKHRYHVNTARQFYLGTPSDEFVKASYIAADAIKVLQEVARPGVSFATVSDELQRYYKQCHLWEPRDWIGGYQLGIAFPPDWVGEFNWNVDLDEDKKEHSKFVQEGLVTNFESFVGGAGFIDTVVFHKDRVEVLSGINPQFLHIDVNAMTERNR